MFLKDHYFISMLFIDDLSNWNASYFQLLASIPMLLNSLCVALPTLFFCSFQEKCKAYSFVQTAILLFTSPRNKKLICSSFVRGDSKIIYFFPKHQIIELFILTQPILWSNTKFISLENSWFYFSFQSESQKPTQVQLITSRLIRTV